MLTPGNKFRQEINETCEPRGCYGVEVGGTEDRNLGESGQIIEQTLIFMKDHLGTS